MAKRTFERRRAKPSPHSRASAQLLPARQRSVWWSSCVCTWQSTRTQSTRPPHSKSGRWRLRAGAEQAALSIVLHRPTFTSYSLFSRWSRRTSSCSHAPRMRRRWSALVLPCTELARFLAAYAAQALAGAIEAVSPPLSPRSVAATSAVLHMLSLCVSGARCHRQMVATGATRVGARAALATVYTRRLHRCRHHSRCRQCQVDE